MPLGEGPSRRSVLTAAGVGGTLALAEGLLSACSRPRPDARVEFGTVRPEHVRSSVTGLSGKILHLYAKTEPKNIEVFQDINYFPNIILNSNNNSPSIANIEGSSVASASLSLTFDTVSLPDVQTQLAVIKKGNQADIQGAIGKLAAEVTGVGFQYTNAQGGITWERIDPMQDLSGRDTQDWQLTAQNPADIRPRVYITNPNYAGAPLKPDLFTEFVTNTNELVTAFQKSI